MNKIDTYVDTPENCLKVRDVRIKHFVDQKNDSPDNFEIAFAYIKSKEIVFWKTYSLIYREAVKFAYTLILKKKL